MTLWGRAVRGPSSARLREPQPSRGKGGGAPLASRGGTGLTSPSRPPAFRGLGGGSGRGSAVPLPPLEPLAQECCPVEVGGGDPQDPLRVSTGRDDKEEQMCARALLPEDLPSVPGAPGPREGGGQARSSPAAGRVGGRREGWAPGALSGERLAHDGVRGGWLGNVVHRVGRAGAGGCLARAFHQYRDFALF